MREPLEKAWTSMRGLDTAVTPFADIGFIGGGAPFKGGMHPRASRTSTTGVRRAA